SLSYSCLFELINPWHGVGYKESVTHKTNLRNQSVMKSFKLITAALSLAAAAGLQATSINFLASADGIAATADYSFTATGGSLVLGNKNGLQLVGVSGGETGSEIDSGQSLLVTLTAPGRLDSLSHALLFNGPEYQDNNEIAAAFTSGLDTYELRLSGENSANWFKNNVW